MVEAKNMRPDLRWIAVDNWLPIEEQPEHYKATQDDNALKSAQLCEKHRAEFYNRAAALGVSVLHTDTVAAARLFGHRTIDIVFVDADHSYKGVKADIESWFPMIAPGGWIGGHDYRNVDPRFRGVDEAVDQIFTRVETDANYTWWKQVK